MNLHHHKSSVAERAAEIRRRWSPVERFHRIGLPPDMPQRLRVQLIGRPECDWPVISQNQPDEARLTLGGSGE